MHRASEAELRSLNEFVLRRQIGLGLTGRVYEAFDKRQQQLVAVKVLRKSLLNDRSLRQRFEAEADIVARFVHPGIVRIHGHGETPNRGWFLVMDLLPNGDLASLSGTSLPIAQAVEWIRDVATAIGYAHSAGVIHCDLKPTNLLLAGDGRVVVTDFGFAQVREASEWSKSCIAGTPTFMAPEQIDAGWGDIGPQTDIYGLGAVLYFLLTGSTPVVGTRLSEIFEQVTSPTEIRAVTELRQDVPAWLAKLCRRCLLKRPSARFQNVEELLVTLSSG
jgi:serine/threonine-protein kinase PpkA